jgi:2-oxoglutarate ferredoxin oxidoreductase subunit delta
MCLKSALDKESRILNFPNFAIIRHGYFEILKLLIMAKMKGYIVVDTERCKGCEVCVGACPTEVIAIAREVNKKGYRYAFMANPEACTGCTNCAVVCPDGVITVYRKKIEG